MCITAVIMKIKVSMAKASSLFVPHLILHSLFPSIFILKLGVMADKMRLQERVLMTDLCLLPCPACIQRTLNPIESTKAHTKVPAFIVIQKKPQLAYLVHKALIFLLCFITNGKVEAVLSIFTCNGKTKLCRKGV